MPYLPGWSVSFGFYWCGEAGDQGDDVEGEEVEDVGGEVAEGMEVWWWCGYGG